MQKVIKLIKELRQDVLELKKDGMANNVAIDRIEKKIEELLRELNIEVVETEETVNTESENFIDNESEFIQYKRPLLMAYFEAHKAMQEELRFDLEKEDLIKIAIEKVAEKYDAMTDDLIYQAKSINFPSIGFDFNEEYLIIHPNWNDNTTEEVNPTLYYKEPYNQFMIDFHTVRLNNLLDGTPYEVSIFQSDEYYDAGENENEYDDFPMFTAYIIDKNGMAIDGTSTGCFCSVKDVINEIEAFAYELLEKEFYDVMLEYSIASSKYSDCMVFADFKINGLINKETGEFSASIKDRLENDLLNPINVTMESIIIDDKRYALAGETNVITIDKEFLEKLAIVNISRFVVDGLSLQFPNIKEIYEQDTERLIELTGSVKGSDIDINRLVAYVMSQYDNSKTIDVDNEISEQLKVLEKAIAINEDKPFVVKWSL